MSSKWPGRERQYPPIILHDAFWRRFSGRKSAKLAFETSLLIQNGSIILKSGTGGADLLLDVAGGIADDGTPVIWYPASGGQSQLWEIIPVLLEGSLGLNKTIISLVKDVV